MNPASKQSNPPARATFIIAALALFALWFVLCRHLSGEWSVNEQYSYGWFVPFFAAFLFWLRWEDRGESRKEKVESRKQGTAIGIAILALVILFPVRLFEVANPDWRPVSWLHAAAVVTLTLTVIWAAGGWSWVRHFAFPVCFIFVAVPWITAIEEPIVQGLMRTVAAVATETISLFGIPAEVEGNLIRVATGLVGVNEACSGVRSLQTSLMIGLLFGELKRLSLAKRCALLAGAVLLALLANFGRALFLIWIAATENVSAVDRWHDIAGYVIVALVFCGSLGLTAVLKRDGKVESKKAKVEDEIRGQRTEDRGRISAPRFLLPTSYFLLSIAWLLAIEAGVEGWYRSHERGMVAREQWTAKWPETAKDFRDIHIDETTKRILRFDEGRGAMWKIQRTEDRGQRTEGGGRRAEGEEAALLYFFRWKAGKNSALLANVHRPDICLPASGWIQVGDYGIRSYRISEDFSLPFRHFLFSQTLSGAGSNGRQRYAHAFYCLREDRVRKADADSLAREISAQQPSDWTRRERLALIAEGRRNLGQQTMEFVLLTQKETPPEEAEARFAAIVRELVERK